MKVALLLLISDQYGTIWNLCVLSKKGYLFLGSSIDRLEVLRRLKIINHYLQKIKLSGRGHNYTEAGMTFDPF